MTRPIYLALCLAGVIAAPSVNAGAAFAWPLDKPLFQVVSGQSNAAGVLPGMDLGMPNSTLTVESVQGVEADTPVMASAPTLRVENRADGLKPSSVAKFEDASSPEAKAAEKLEIAPPPMPPSELRLTPKPAPAPAAAPVPVPAPKAESKPPVSKLVPADEIRVREYRIPVGFAWGPLDAAAAEPEVKAPDVKAPEVKTSEILPPASVLNPPKALAQTKPAPEPATKPAPKPAAKPVVITPTVPSNSIIKAETLPSPVVGAADVFAPVSTPSSSLVAEEASPSSEIKAAPESQAPTQWVLRAGRMIQDELREWAARTKKTDTPWTFTWNVDRGWRVPADAHYEGEFDVAVETVIRALRDQGRPVRADIWEGNRMIEVFHVDAR